MDEDALVPGGQPAAPAWRLAPGFDSSTQGLIVSGFGHLPYAEALFLRQVSPGAAWLALLDQVAPITDATGPAARAATLAFTGTGLAALGVAESVLASFDAPFREGMHAPERSRRLGDANLDTVADGGIRWSSNSPAGPETPHAIHALLLLYGSAGETVGAWATEVLSALGSHVVCEHRLSLDLQIDERGLVREHFGFTDGISQPIPHGAAIVGQAGCLERWHGIESGDVLMGHLNAHHEPAPGPYVPDAPIARAAGLVAGNAPPGCLDLGLNGSYLVVRELQQDVAGFWRCMDRSAAAIREADPSAAHVTAEWLAERVVGRDMNGHLLCPGGVLDPGPDGQPQNEVGFFEGDAFGLGCPMGSHVRRSNPRDGLAETPVFRQALLDAANNHRILRRGRKYGTRARGLRAPDGQERGLLFMCLNTDIVRQFEFVQQTWLLNPNFATLRDHTDPLIGPKGLFTLQERPLRRIFELETFVRLAGGEYFFLPSIPAIRYLRTLPPREG